ncbi:MAG: hypothetical protein K6C35_05165 [Eubacterium sp.]|nr:hypothetical protein [Eubacterium sp.]
MSEFRVMARLELINLFGLNTCRYTRDKKEKKKKKALLATLAFIGLMLMGYTCSTAYGFVYLGLSDKIPATFLLLSFMLQLGLGVFKSKSLIYREKDLELLSGLPVSGIHVAAARMLRLYVEGLIITTIIMFPGLILCGVDTGAGVLFYAGILPLILVLPILPVAVSAWVGILFAAVIARFRHKVLAEALFVIIVVIGMFIMSASMSTNSMTGGDNSIVSAIETDKKLTKEEKSEQKKKEEERLKAKMSDAAKKAVDSLETACPPAKILGKAILKPDFTVLLIYFLISMIIYILTSFAIGRNFFRLSSRLRTVTRHREYHLEAMSEQSLMKSLVKKEAAQYFSSGIYVANTIVGPLLAVGMSVALAFINLSKPIPDLPSANPEAGIPYLLAGFFSMLSISSCSVSFEGKRWWLPKSLPLSSREILGAKALFNMIFLLPFYGLMEVILLFTVRTDLMGRLWLVLIPLVSIPFAVLFGLIMNLRFPKLHWENEVEVVKQSASGALSFLGGFLIILPGLGAVFLQGFLRNILNLAVFLVILGLTLLMYKKISNYHIGKLEG